MTHLSWKQNQISFNNCRQFPSQLSALICGSRGSGKTVLTFRFLLEQCPIHNQDFLDYDKLIIITPSIDVVEWKIIIKGFKEGLTKSQILKLFQLQHDISDPVKAIDSVINQIPQNLRKKKEVITFTHPQDVPPPEELNKDKKKCLVICDDCMLLDNGNITNIFVYGRPLQINIIMLTQSFTQIDKRTIRDQAEFFVFFKTSDVNLETIYRHLASNDFNRFEDFKVFCHQAWKQPYGFITVNWKSSEYSNNLIINNMINTNAVAFANAKDNILNTIRQTNISKQTYQLHQQEKQKPTVEAIKNTATETTFSNNTKPPLALEHKPETTKDAELMENYKELIDTESDSDKIDRFSIAAYSNGDYYFHAMDEFEEAKNSDGSFQFEDPRHVIDIQWDTKRIICHKNGEESEAFELTENLMAFLTKEIDDNHDANAKRDYVLIIDYCLGEQLKLLKTKKGNLAARAEIKEKFRKSSKFRNTIARQFNIKGDGYKDISKKTPVIFSPQSCQNSDIQRLHVLLASKHAGNENKEIEEEGVKLLNELYEKKHINKKIYKTLYYKFIL